MEDCLREGDELQGVSCVHRIDRHAQLEDAARLLEMDGTHEVAKTY